jgi:aquaporin Z
VSVHDARNFFVEIVLSAILVTVVLQVTRTPKYGATALIAYPLTYAAMYFAGLGITSTGVNPARSFAPVLLSGDHWADVWIFIVAPPIGAIVGWAAHMITVRGDTALRGDLMQAATEMRSVEMDDLRQGPGQVPPPESPPASSPGS